MLQAAKAQDNVFVLWRELQIKRTKTFTDVRNEHNSGQTNIFDICT